MCNRILLLCSLSLIALSISAADRKKDAGWAQEETPVNTTTLPNMPHNKKYTIPNCGAIICSSPRYIASVQDKTGIELYNRTNNYEKTKWNVNNFKNIFAIKAVFLGDDHLVTVENPSDGFQVISTTDAQSKAITCKTPLPTNRRGMDANQMHIDGLHTIPYHPTQLLINSFPHGVGVIDVDHDKIICSLPITRPVEHIIPDNSGNVAWYVTGKQLNYWDFRTDTVVTKSPLDTNVVNASLALSPDNNTCAMICIKQDRDKELRIFDLRTQKLDRVLPMPYHTTTDMSSLSFMDNNNILFNSMNDHDAYKLNSIGVRKSLRENRTSVVLFVSPYLIKYHQNSNFFVGYPGAGIVHIFDPIYKL